MLFACAALAVPAPASAGRVLVLERDGGVAERSDPGVRSREAGPRTHLRDRAAAAPAPRAAGARAARAPKRTVVRELQRMRDAGAIDAASYRERRDDYRAAKAYVKRLPAGRRRIEMAGVVAVVERIAARGSLTVSRVEPLWLALERNRRWWGTGPLLASGQRVSFEGSEVVWQYVPGQGLAIHPLANFGKLNALWRSRANRRLALLLDELLAVAAQRGGGLAWEYYFDYGGGRAPWVSALAQGTGLQSMARAAIRLDRREEVLPVARRGLRIFQLPPPTGVRVDADGGAHYLIYSFNPRLQVLNGFVQALVGLYDFGKYANDDEARRLFADGERAARSQVPRHDTGAWSLYARGSVSYESNLSYHQLLTDFLKSLCERTVDPVYCGARERFESYVREAPRLELVTRRLRGGRTGSIRFDLSKISRVGIRVTRCDRVLLSRALTMGYGRRGFAWAVPRRAGRYAVRLTAVDLAGNTSQVTGAVRVLRPKKPRRRG